MFIGHHAVAFGAKRAAPQVSLAVLMFAAMFLDLLWPILCLAGIEHFRIDPGNTAFTPLDFYDYPITHSLAMALVWSLLGAAVFRRWIVGFAVLSHWILDFVTHRPDLALWPGGPKVGLGLWNSVPATVAVEVALFALGIWLYLRHRRGSIAFWSLIAFLVIIYIANIVSPPPPSWRAVAWTALAAWLFVPWAWWIDRHPRART
jgi:hypothetical protein